MNFFFHPEAEKELMEAARYYENCEKGLGADFLIESYSAIKNIQAYPIAWTKVENDIRRYLLNRFPFAILYSFEQDAVYILAVMNLHREPGYWKERV